MYFYSKRRLFVFLSILLLVCVFFINRIDASPVFSFPSTVWQAHKTSKGRYSIFSNKLCIYSMKPGGAWFTTRRPYGFDRDYTVQFDVRLNTSNNHSPILYDDGFVWVFIDWGTDLGHYQPGLAYSVRNHLANLRVGVWYRIRVDAHPSKRTFDLYLNGRLLSVARDIKPFHRYCASLRFSKRNYIFIGDIDSVSDRGGAYNRGNVCWRNITVKVYGKTSVSFWGGLWVVDNTGYIYRWNGSGWIRIAGRARDVGVGADGSVWVVGMDRTRGGYGIYRWSGSGWVRMTGGAVRIDVGPRGNPWVVNSFGDIYRWNGSGWIRIAGRARDVGVGADGSVWVVGMDRTRGGYGIYRWSGSGWVRMPGGAVRIDVGPRGNPWVVNSFGDIYRWNGSGWVKTPGKAHDVSVGADGRVWVIGTNPMSGGYGIYRWSGSGWVRMPGGAVSISAGGKVVGTIPSSPVVRGRLNRLLVSGMYCVEQHIGSRVYHSVWVLKVRGNSVNGVSDWKCCPSHRLDRIRGTIKDNIIVMERVYPGGGKQMFRGRLVGNRVIGSCSGRGIGTNQATWVLYLK